MNFACHEFALSGLRPARSLQRSLHRRRCCRSHGGCAPSSTPPRRGVSWRSEAAAAWCTLPSPASRWRVDRSLAGEAWCRWRALARCHCSRGIATEKRTRSLWWCMLACWISFGPFSTHSKARLVCFLCSLISLCLFHGLKTCFMIIFLSQFYWQSQNIMI